MASIGTATIQQLYAAKASVSATDLALEAFALVLNPAKVPNADAALAAMMAALAPFVVTGVPPGAGVVHPGDDVLITNSNTSATGSALITSGVVSLILANDLAVVQDGETISGTLNGHAVDVLFQISLDNIAATISGSSDFIVNAGDSVPVEGLSSAQVGTAIHSPDDGTLQVQLDSSVILIGTESEIPCTLTGGGVITVTISMDVSGNVSGVQLPT